MTPAVGSPAAPTGSRSRWWRRPGRPGPVSERSRVGIKYSSWCQAWPGYPALMNIIDCIALTLGPISARIRGWRGRPCAGMVVRRACLRSNSSSVPLQCDIAGTAPLADGGSVLDRAVVAARTHRTASSFTAATSSGLSAPPRSAMKPNSAVPGEFERTGFGKHGLRVRGRHGFQAWSRPGGRMSSPNPVDLLTSHPGAKLVLTEWVPVRRARTDVTFRGPAN